MEKRKIKSYTEDFKQSSAKLAVESERSISATARSLARIFHEGALKLLKSYNIQHLTTNKT